jgi:phospholipid/cholesterol/gamma-HCH transport system substrate-binding protein
MQVRVGFFVVLILALFAMSMYILGREKNLFKSQSKLYAYFTNISGLKPSSPVQLAGVSIGVVNAIDLPHLTRDKRITVELKVNSDVLDKIREDSVATIDSQGLLGDKLINITIGSSELKQLKDGDMIKTSNPTDFNEAIKTGQEILENIRKISRDLKTGVAAYTTPEFEKEVKTIVSSISDTARNIAEGPGTLHELIYSESLKHEARAISAHMVELSKRLNDSVAVVKTIVSDIKEGEGTVHGLIYEKDGKRILDALSKAGSDIAMLVDAIKTQKDSPVHRLIFADGKPTFVDDLEKAGANIREITDSIKKGEGTVGGLISDPTVYEDLKSILGSLKRNEIIKSLVRFSLANYEDKGKKTEPPPPQMEPAKQ